MKSLKGSLRAELRTRLKDLPSAIQAAESRRACEVFLSQSLFQRAASILLYMPLQGEVDVRLIMERAVSNGKRVALPRFVPETGHYETFFIDDKPLKPGPFGVLEPGNALPAPLNLLDLVVVPGLGFDWRGRRLGRGKGFYDRLLSEATGVKCGICFDEQILAEIPIEAHDVSVDYLATPSRWQDCRGSSPSLK